MRNRPVRLGLLRLTDAAPIILAQEQGLFAAQGLDVTLSIEPSWSNIADKLAYGLLDGAVMLPPLAIACALGLRGRRTGLIVPMTLSLNGNAVTLAQRWQDEIISAPHEAEAVGFSFYKAMARHGRRPILAVVHGFSTQDLLLRHWLAKANIDPDQDVRLTVLPPAEMLGSLAAGAIDGFCAGAPWGTIAARSGLGFQAVYSSAIKPNHAEKCLALRSAWAADNPIRLHGLLAAVGQAAALCAAPEHRAMLATLLSGPDYLALPADLIAASLDPEAGGPVFTPPRAITADPQDARWFAAEMVRWGYAATGSEEDATLLYQVPNRLQNSQSDQNRPIKD